MKERQKVFKFQGAALGDKRGLSGTTAGGYRPVAFHDDRKQDRRLVTIVYRIGWCVGKPIWSTTLM